MESSSALGLWLFPAGAPIPSLLPVTLLADSASTTKGMEECADRLAMLPRNTNGIGARASPRQGLPVQGPYPTASVHGLGIPMAAGDW